MTFPTKLKWFFFFSWEKSVCPKKAERCNEFFCHSSYQTGLLHPDLWHINKLKTTPQLPLHALWLICMCSLTWILPGISSCLTLQWKLFLLYFSIQDIHGPDIISLKVLHCSVFREHFTGMREDAEVDFAWIFGSVCWSPWHTASSKWSSALGSLSIKRLWKQTQQNPSSWAQTYPKKMLFCFFTEHHQGIKCFSAFSLRCSYIPQKSIRATFSSKCQS